MKEMFKNDEEFFKLYMYLIQDYDSLERAYNPRLVEGNRLANTYKQYFELLYNWLFNRNKNKMIYDYLKINQINNIAIYGCGSISNLLYEELKSQNEIKISFFVDSKKKSNVFNNIPVIGIEETPLNCVDAILVTPIYDYVEIKSNLERYYKCKILSLQYLVENAGE